MKILQALFNIFDNMSDAIENIDYIDEYTGIEEDDEDSEEIDNNKKAVQPKFLNDNDNDNDDYNDYEDVHNLNPDDSLFRPPPVYISEEVKEICKINGLPYYFKSREQAKYLIRLSQCKITRRFTVPKSEDRRYYIRCCSYPDCNFNIKVQKSVTYGELIVGGDGVHTCNVNDHYINHFEKTSTASASCSPRPSSCSSPASRRSIYPSLRCS